MMMSLISLATPAGRRRQPIAAPTLALTTLTLTTSIQFNSMTVIIIFNFMLGLRLARVSPVLWEPTAILRFRLVAGELAKNSLPAKQAVVAADTLAGCMLISPIAPIAIASYELAFGSVERVRGRKRNTARTGTQAQRKWCRAVRNRSTGSRTNYTTPVVLHALE